MNTPTPADCWKLLLDDPSNAPVGDEKMVLVMPSSYQYTLIVLEILPLPTPGPHYMIIRAAAEGMRLLFKFFPLWARVYCSPFSSVRHQSDNELQ